MNQILSFSKPKNIFMNRLIFTKINFDFNEIKFNENKYTGAKSKNLSVKKLRTILPDYEQIYLKDGLKETIIDLEKKI